MKKVITITQASEDETKFTIVDQNHVKYTGFKTWEGNNTQAYNAFLSGNHNEAFNVGDHAYLSDKETRKANQYGKEVTYRNVVGLLPSQAPLCIVHLTPLTIAS